MNDICRDKFETWMTDGGKFPLAVERLGDRYRLLQAETAWQAWQSAWQAGRASMRDEAAALVAPKCKRYCDCDVCDCGNLEDLVDVTAWDSDMVAANAIKAIEP